jgi:hypothetical protein
MTLKQSRGVVSRIVGQSLVYVVIEDERRSLSFVPLAIENYTGEAFEDLGIQLGAEVDVEFDQVSGVVSRVRPVADAFESDEITDGSHAAVETPPKTPPAAGPVAAQVELLPTAAAIAAAPVTRALPAATRSFGKLLDTRTLRPGDLLLAREMSPDRISTMIGEVQAAGGYEPLDARWTHAAMYVGDGVHVVEATFDSVAAGGDVRLTSLDEYCNGQSVLRFRRSRYVTSEPDGWRLCVRALSRLKQPYGLLLAAQMWFRVVMQGRGFFDTSWGRSASAAVVCSTLYADAYNEATRRSLGEINGACVPAWLSASDEFDDVAVNWIQISRT